MVGVVCCLVTPRSPNVTANTKLSAVLCCVSSSCNSSLQCPYLALYVCYAALPSLPPFPYAVASTSPAPCRWPPGSYPPHADASPLPITMQGHVSRVYTVPNLSPSQPPPSPSPAPYLIDHHCLHYHHLLHTHRQHHPYHPCCHCTNSTPSPAPPLQQPIIPCSRDVDSGNDVHSAVRSISVGLSMALTQAAARPSCMAAPHCVSGGGSRGTAGPRPGARGPHRQCTPRPAPLKKTKSIHDAVQSRKVLKAADLRQTGGVVRRGADGAGGLTVAAMLLDRLVAQLTSAPPHN